MPTILELSRKKSADIFDNIHKHPFVVQIHAGTLPQSQFDCYCEQDDLYLERWVEIIQGLLERLRQHPLAEGSAFIDDLDFIQQHLETVREMIHAGVFNPKRKKSDFSPVPKIQLIDEYLDHLTHAARHSTSIAIGLASLFGCYDLYRQIGIYSQKHAVTDEHTYYPWLAANYDEEFVATAERIFKLTDRIASFELTTRILENVDPIIDAARRSYDYEWAFFIAVTEDCTALPTKRCLL